MISRRSLLGAALASFTAPAFIKSAMPVKALDPTGWAYDIRSRVLIPENVNGRAVALPETAEELAGFAYLSSARILFPAAILSEIEANMSRHYERSVSEWAALCARKWELK